MFPYIEFSCDSKIKVITTLALNATKDNPYGDTNLALHVGDDEKKVTQNRKELLKIIPKKTYWLDQTHSNIALDLDKESGNFADASFTRDKNKVCVVLTADCLPVLITDKKNSFIAAIHAGWRGLLNGIITNTLNKVASSEYVVWLGPAIGPKNFQVGKEVYEFFMDKDNKNENSFRKNDNKYLADIYQLAKNELKNFDVLKVYNNNYCTVEDNRFYSYRRSQTTGRMASVICFN